MKRTKLLIALLLPIALAMPMALQADEDTDDAGVEARTDCGSDFVCPFPNAVCCPGQKRCCPARQQCPADPEDECIYVEPEDEVGDF